MHETIYRIHVDYGDIVDGTNEWVLGQNRTVDEALISMNIQCARQYFNDFHI